MALSDITSAIRHLEGQTRSILPLFDDEVMTPESTSVDAAMKSDDDVLVFAHHSSFLLRSFFIGFEPRQQIPQGVGLIICPGGLVDARAYSPIARSMAELGYHAAILTPPFKLSLLDADLADEVLEYVPWKDEVHTWVIAGHSLGGVASCIYCKNKNKNNTTDSGYDSSSKVKGLVLLASYPSSNEGIFNGDLSASTNLQVSSVYGTMDALTTLEDIKTSKQYLPPTTKFIPIIGGNHTQFYYTDKELQKGDQYATISRDEQQRATREAILDVLQDLTIA